MSDAPLPNSAEARTPDGTLKDVSTPKTEVLPPETPSPTTTSTPTSEPKPPTEATTTADPDKPEPTLLDGDTKPAEGDKPAPAAGAPEKYEPFTAPEGYEINPDVIAKAEPVFKELGLSQEAAQKLVNLYGTQVLEMAEAPYKQWNETQTKWKGETTAWLQSQNLEVKKVQETIGRALDSLGDPGLTQNFKHVMNLTGAGNHRAFVQAFYKLAQQVTEGRHVAGSGPSTFGQVGPGSKPATAAQAMYPNLPSSG